MTMKEYNTPREDDRCSSVMGRLVRASEHASEGICRGTVLERTNRSMTLREYDSPREDDCCTSVMDRLVRASEHASEGICRGTVREQVARTSRAVTIREAVTMDGRRRLILLPQ